MAEPLRLQISLDEQSRDRLRNLAGSGQASVGWFVGRLVEAGLAEKKRLMGAILRRMERAMRGDLPQTERAGVVAVPVPPKVGIELADFGAALEHSAGGIAGLIVKVVLEDDAWTMTVFAESMGDRSKA